MKNGVKNLKEARIFPKTFSNNAIGNAYYQVSSLKKKSLSFIIRHGTF